MLLQLTLNLLFGDANTPNNAIYRKRYAVGPGFERPSRIVVKEVRISQPHPSLAELVTPSRLQARAPRGLRAI